MCVEVGLAKGSSKGQHSLQPVPKSCWQGSLECVEHLCPEKLSEESERTAWCQEMAGLWLSPVFCGRAIVRFPATHVPYLSVFKL